MQESTRIDYSCLDCCTVQTTAGCWHSKAFPLFYLLCSMLLPLSVKLEGPNSSMLLAQEEYTEIRFVKKDEESAQMSGAEGGSAGKCLDNWKPTKRNKLLNERAKMKCCSCVFGCHMCLFTDAVMEWMKLFSVSVQPLRLCLCSSLWERA